MDQLLVDAGAILLRPGVLQIEPGFEYARFSGDRVAILGLTILEAIIIGEIRFDRLERDILTASLRARYGIMRRVQADLFVPFLYRRDVEVLGVSTQNVTEHVIEDYGLGDIEAGITWQAVLARGWIPGILIRARARFPTGRDAFGIPRVIIEDFAEERLTQPPTGSGFFSVGGTVTAVWSIDPVAFFAGGGYWFNLKRTFSGIGRVNPGDSYEFFAGLNVALNDKVSINISFINQHTKTTRQNGIRQVGTAFNDARLTLGTSLALGRSWSLLVTAAAGLTEQSPDFAFSISVPITFTLY